MCVEGGPCLHPLQPKNPGILLVCDGVHGGSPCAGAPKQGGSVSWGGAGNFQESPPIVQGVVQGQVKFGQGFPPIGCVILANL